MEPAGLFGKVRRGVKLMLKLMLMLLSAGMRSNFGLRPVAAPRRWRGSPFGNNRTQKVARQILSS